MSGRSAAGSGWNERFSAIPPGRATDSDSAFHIMHSLPHIAWGAGSGWPKRAGAVSHNSKHEANPRSHVA